MFVAKFQCVALMIDAAEILANAIDGPISDLIETPNTTNIFAPPSPLLFQFEKPSTSSQVLPRQLRDSTLQRSPCTAEVRGLRLCFTGDASGVSGDL